MSEWFVRFCSSYHKYSIKAEFGEFWDLGPRFVLKNQEQPHSFVSGYGQVTPVHEAKC